MKSAPSPIELAVAEYTATLGITHTCTFVRATKRDEWECDQWEFKITAGNKTERFDYYTGTAYRSPIVQPQFGPMPRRGTLAYAALERERKPIAPPVAGLLYSLILDAQASGQTFNSWCDGFGYDSDSRKVHKTYEACLETAEKLERLFKRSEVEKLSELMQVY